jgi:general stress protein 26
VIVQASGEDSIGRAELLSFMREHPFAVQASVSSAGAPQAALVGIAVSDDLEVLFDADAGSRKVENLRQNPRIALVLGGTKTGDERTLQYDGVADEPQGEELERLQAAYFEVFPAGRERQTWPGITYIRARPTWIRYTDFNVDPPLAVEFDPGDL